MSEIRTTLRTKVLLILGGSFAALLTMELVLLPSLLSYTPLRLHVYLDPGIRALAQTSKASLVPRDYVALVGDSYAQGRGDWLLSQDPDGNGPFHSAHVLHEQTGRDVVSFAQGGVGAIGAAVEAVARHRYLASSWRFRIDPPDDLLIYFYEGNDLPDTLVELFYLTRQTSPRAGDEPFEALSRESRERFRGVREDPSFGDPERLRELLDGRVAAHPLVRRAERPIPDFQVARFAGAAVRGEWLGRRGALDREDIFPLERQLPKSVVPQNVLRIGGEDVPVSVWLQGPAAPLTPPEVDASFWAVEVAWAYLIGSFARSAACIVYIPSPAASYRSARPTLFLDTLADRMYEFSAAFVEQRSRELRARVAAIADRLRARFVDSTEWVHENSAETLLHGPRDARHFNRRGYLLLGHAAARCLEPDP